ncbi:hypothetical protein [Streptomyces sp. NPDC050287]
MSATALRRLPCTVLRPHRTALIVWGLALAAAFRLLRRRSA